MGIVAELWRISQETFEEVEENEEYPDRQSVKEVLYVDKFWEPIMYLFGQRFIGSVPTVYLFQPRNLIVTYEDEYMREGIRYHSEIDIAELSHYLQQHEPQALLQNLDLQQMNSKVAYAVATEDLGQLQQLLGATQQFFHRAGLERDVILGRLG